MVEEQEVCDTAYSDYVEASIELVAIGLKCVFQVVVKAVEVVDEHLLQRACAKCYIKTLREEGGTYCGCTAG